MAGTRSGRGEGGDQCAERARPTADVLHEWLVTHRLKVPDGSASAKAIDYSLKRWVALIRYIDDGNLPIDNNWMEKRIRPVALGRSNWLFAGSLRAGKRAAVIMSLIQSAKLNGLDPYRYLRDVLERLPTQPASRLEELLPHRGRVRNLVEIDGSSPGMFISNSVMPRCQVCWVEGEASASHRPCAA